MAWQPKNVEFRARCFKPRVGLYKKGLTYDQQGAIYFTCKHYFTILTRDEQERFKRLLWECCLYEKNRYDGLFEYLTCELSAEDICEIYFISRTTFYRILDEFYLNFDYIKRVY